MAQVTYFLVMPFHRDHDGHLVAGDPQVMPSAFAARRFAEALRFIPGKAGAIAFSRSGDPSTDEFQKPQVIAEFGEVDRRALTN